MQNRLSPHPSALDDRYHIKQIKVQDGQKQHITRKGIPMRLSADFSAEILQARREWHDIFEVLKGKNPQTRLLSKSLVQIQKRNQNPYRQANAERIQHHHTNFATNAKGT